VRISRDKVNKVAHVVTDALAGIDELDFVEDRNTIRLEVRKILEDLLNQEAKIDQHEGGRGARGRQWSAPATRNAPRRRTPPLLDGRRCLQRGLIARAARIARGSYARGTARLAPEDADPRRP